ncbi:hypothetical protein [Mesorhizobium sp.]|uniref:hypothetical protein n=1 Tax=Mesorhizobium sp. TaxID=1871066 RepID=UPI00257ABC34|nr:hypothetical protein [Mesorhizobium sp.]
MLFAVFTGSFLGVSWDRQAIDTRLLTVNVFYREKTVLRQLFFHDEAARSCGCAEDRTLEPGLTSEKRFRFLGACARASAYRASSRPPQAPARNGAGDVEEQQRLQGRLQSRFAAA